MPARHKPLPVWGYTEANGPAVWGDLSPHYALCKTGKRQSPIDIPSTAPHNPDDLVFDYAPSALQIFNTGNSIQANYDAGSALEVDGQRYPLIQFHFHNPSENTVDGITTPMEMHLVHITAHADVAVVGVFLVEGNENVAYAPVFDHMPRCAGDSVHVGGQTIDARTLLPAGRSYWRWDGSLTTPPCSEGIKWFMLRSPVELSTSQIEAFKSLYTGNARPVQPMNEREFIVGQRN